MCQNRLAKAKATACCAAVWLVGKIMKSAHLKIKILIIRLEKLVLL